MIFAHTIANVLNGKKSQTRRLCYPSDTLGYVTIKGQKRLAVFDNTYKDRPRTRWIIGHTYAVQPERCHFAQGRIKSPVCSAKKTRSKSPKPTRSQRDSSLQKRSVKRGNRSTRRSRFSQFG